MKKYNSGNKNCYYFLNRLLKKADNSLYNVWQNFQHIGNKKIQKKSKNLPSHHWKTAFRMIASKAKSLSSEEIQTLNKIIEIVRNPKDFLFDSSNRKKKIINFRSDKSENEFIEKCREIYNNISGMLQDETKTEANSKENNNNNKNNNNDNNSAMKSEENSQVLEENQKKNEEEVEPESMEEEKAFAEESSNALSYFEETTQDRTISHEYIEYPAIILSNVSLNDYQCRNLVKYEILEDEEKQSLKKKIEQLENEIRVLKMKQQINDDSLLCKRTVSEQEDFVSKCIKSG